MLCRGIEPTGARDYVRSAVTSWTTKKGIALVILAQLVHFVIGLHFFTCLIRYKIIVQHVGYHTFMYRKELVFRWHLEEL